MLPACLGANAIDPHPTTVTIAGFQAAVHFSVWLLNTHSYDIELRYRVENYTLIVMTRENLRVHPRDSFVYHLRKGLVTKNVCLSHQKYLGLGGTKMNPESSLFEVSLFMQKNNFHGMGSTHRFPPWWAIMKTDRKWRGPFHSSMLTNKVLSCRGKSCSTTVLKIPTISSTDLW